jgi:hypothetical protein
MGSNQLPLAAGARAVLLGRTGYLMTYEVSDGRVTVFRVLHGARGRA